MLRWTGIALFILGLIDAAHAHFVWLEREGDGPARAYFGEWIDDIREKIGGLLDRFKTPHAYLGTSADLLPVERNENNLEVQVKGRGDVRFTDSSIPPREDKEKSVQPLIVRSQSWYGRAVAVKCQTGFSRSS